MAQAKGSKGQLLIDSETTFKSTRAVVDAHVLPFTSESFKMSRNLIDSASIRSNRNPYEPVRGNQDVAGDITVELDPYMGRMFYHALGTFSTTGSNPYSHTFTISDLPTGLTVEKGFTDINQYFVFNGCKVNSMRMTLRPEGFIETVFNLMGATTTISTTSIDASPTNYSTSAVGGPFDGFDIRLYEGGSLLCTATEMEFTLENNLDGSVYVISCTDAGTGTRYSLPEGLVKISGTVRCLFEDVTLYNKALNSQETSLKAIITQGTGAGTAYNEKMEIYIDELYFSPDAPVINGPQGILVELPFTGYYKDGSHSSAFAIVLWNTQTAGNIQS